ncbi:MAG: YegP family protein [Candidatus Bathyarchaeia archaeon]
MPEPRFEIYKDASGRFRFRLRAANNEIIAVSDAYESKDGCENGVASVKENAPKAMVQDLT